MGCQKKKVEWVVERVREDELYHFGGSMKLNTRILFFTHMVYL
jgi:hypothetical protein